MMGDSAGRSGKNRTGRGAERRNTDRERAGVDPVFSEGPPRERWLDDTGEWYWTKRGWWLVNFFAWSAWVVFCVLFALIIAAWFGLVG